jgi:hypothetical protein
MPFPVIPPAASRKSESQTWRQGLWATYLESPSHAYTRCGGWTWARSVCRELRRFCISLGQGFTPARAKIRMNCPQVQAGLAVAGDIVHGTRLR